MKYKRQKKVWYGTVWYGIDKLKLSEPYITLISLLSFQTLKKCNRMDSSATFHLDGC
jgi:hypothetical protein